MVGVRDLEAGDVYIRTVADPGDVRARLERQAAEIIGRARSEAATVLRVANEQAEELLAAARREAERLRLEGVDERDAARREVQVAQEQATRIRTDAQRTADSIIERAKRRARSEADELLGDARRQLAKAVADVQEARRLAEQLRADAERAELERLERVATGPVVVDELVLIDVRGADAVVDLTGDLAAAHQPVQLLTAEPAVAVASGPMTADELRAWISDLSDATLDELVAGAVACAVHKAVGPTIIRAGRYTITQPLT